VRKKERTVPEKTIIPGREREADLLRLTRAWIDNLEWDESEYGGWVVDPKHPFGNSGENQIALDILEIIQFDTKVQTCPHCHKELPPPTRWRWQRNTPTNCFVRSPCSSRG
jgi:hypothetical protein